MLSKKPPPVTPTPKVLVAGLTPAWQQILQFDRFDVGEVNRARSAQWCASGKPPNVAMAVQRLGVPCSLLIPSGSGTGLQLLMDLASQGIDVETELTDERTRICTTILDAATGQTTELVENALPLSTKVIKKLIRRVRQLADAADVLVLTGSLPPGSPTSFYYDILKGKDQPTILDVRGPELLEALAAKPLLVKPNVHELGMTVGRPLQNLSDLRSAMKEVHQAGAERVVVTNGVQPIQILGPDGFAQITPPRAPQCVNPIGCGDCLAAGIAVGLAEGQPMESAISLGTAAAVANVATLLPARFDATDVRQRANDIIWQRGGG